MTGPSSDTSHHLYRCPLRWGDIDMLGHTNNVRYLDYVQEARLELLAAAGVAVDPRDADEVVVGRHDVSFDAPLMFREQPVTVTSAVTGLTAESVVLEHAVVDRPGEGAVADGGDEVVYFRARTELTVRSRDTGTVRPLSPQQRHALEAYAVPGRGPSRLSSDLTALAPDPSAAYHVRTRRSDVDGDGRVGDVAQVEYLQEARLRMLGLERWAGHDGDHGRAGGFENMLVVASTTLAYDRPVHFRLRPYEVRSWVSRIGGASFDVSSVVLDPEGAGADAAPGPLVRGRVTLVAFDPQSQRSTTLTESSRAVLERLSG